MSKEHLQTGEFKTVGELVTFLSTLDKNRGVTNKYGEILRVQFNPYDSGEDLTFEPGEYPEETEEIL